MAHSRISTGLPALDTVLDGGFLPNTINLLMGPPGTGKTILAGQMVFANASSSARALYLTTFSEPLEKIIAHGQTYAFFKVANVGRDVLYEDLSVKLRERGIMALAEAVTELITRHRPKIIVIDSLKALSELGPSPEARRLALFDLATLLTSQDCTTFFLGEYASEMMTDLPEFAIADSIVQLMKRVVGGRAEVSPRGEVARVQIHPWASWVLDHGTGSPGLPPSADTEEVFRLQDRAITHPFRHRRSG
jgi:circadian clock protein KaiC